MGHVEPAVKFAKRKYCALASLKASMVEWVTAKAQSIGAKIRVGEAKDWVLRKAKGWKRVGVIVITRAVSGAYKITVRVADEERAGPIFTKAGVYVPFVNTVV